VISSSRGVSILEGAVMCIKEFDFLLHGIRHPMLGAIAADSIGRGALFALVKDGAIVADFKVTLATLDRHILTNALSDADFLARAATIVQQRHRDITRCPSQQILW
jgi:hypothetical protein